MSPHLSLSVLSAELDGELADSVSLAAAEHLRDCAACRQRQGRLEEARSALRSLPRRSSSPVALQGRLRVSLAAQRAAQRASAGRELPPFWRRLGPSAMAGAGTWFLALLLLLLYSAPVRGFEDAGELRRRSETWQRLERFEALLALEPGSPAQPAGLSGNARSPRP